MVDFVARQFARDISFTFIGSKITSNNPLKIVFRCPICGDSKTDKHKRRGWIYEEKGKIWMKCFNCDYTKPFVSYMKEYHPDSYRDYLLESRKEQMSETRHSEPEPDLSKFNKVLPTIKTNVLDEFGTRCDRLPEGHPALVYMRNRKIPQDKLSLFWFTMDWRKLTNKVIEGTYKDEKTEPRIVIPIFDEAGGISAMQGRALRQSEQVRYITIKASEESNKIFGLERVDESKSIFILEGPIDSVFIDNGIAMAGGVMSTIDAPFKSQRVWVLDNEPRARDTCKRINKLIEAGERVVIWDKFKYTSKDVNDMILKENATIEEINEYLRSNIVSGNIAKFRFGNWKKVAI